MNLEVHSCPKHMEFGPCADLGPDGTCEVPVTSGGPGRCVFVDVPLPRWPASHVHPTVASPRALPVVMTELPDFVNNGAEIRRLARGLAGHVDAVLFGDSNWARVKFPPSYRSALVQDEGLAAWPGLNARDRNRVALEGELAAIADLGVAGVHCVTGNHTLSGNRPDAAPVFDLDSTRLTALATSMGLTVSVAASPHTPPVSSRPIRTADKAVAGARVCMVDQPSTIGELREFVDGVVAHGAPGLSFLPVITVLLSSDDFDRWSQYPNARIPPGWAEAFTAASSRGATPHEFETLGRTLAVDLASKLCSVSGVGGVLFGATSDPQRADDVVAAFRDVAAEMRRRLRT
jgi:methylenetetrahydrofolate reductase (NADPH)